jgi:hypothetical protein
VTHILGDEHCEPIAQFEVPEHVAFVTVGIMAAQFVLEDI